MDKKDSGSADKPPKKDDDVSIDSLVQNFVDADIAFLDARDAQIREKQEIEMGDEGLSTRLQKIWDVQDANVDHVQAVSDEIDHFYDTIDAAMKVFSANKVSTSGLESTAFAARDKMLEFAYKLYPSNDGNADPIPKKLLRRRLKKGGDDGCASRYRINRPYQPEAPEEDLLFQSYLDQLDNVQVLRCKIKEEIGNRSPDWCDEMDEDDYLDKCPTCHDSFTSQLKAGKDFWETWNTFTSCREMTLESKNASALQYEEDYLEDCENDFFDKVDGDDYDEQEPPKKQG